jgi:hypothetical protein
MRIAWQRALQTSFTQSEALPIELPPWKPAAFYVVNRAVLPPDLGHLMNHDNITDIATYFARVADQLAELAVYIL